MSRLKEVYNLKKDTERIKNIQQSSIDKKSHSGYKIEEGLLFGTKEWFDAIEAGKICKYVIEGVISRVYLSGHNDYPEFEIENNQGTTTWTREGNDSAYKVGRSVEVVYVKQKYKRPSGISGVCSSCVIEIKISE
jgi:hypothetical protein